MITALLIAVIVLLYLLGCMLMRGFLKVADTTDQDSIVQVLIWPYTMCAVIYELAFVEKSFKW